VTHASRELSGRLADGRQSGHRPTRSAWGLYSDSVVDGTLDALLAAKISLRCWYRDVPKQKLDLFQFTSGRVAKPSTSPAQVMGCQFVDPSSCGIFPHHMPYGLFRKALSPRLSHLVHAKKQLTRCEVSSFDPLVQNLLHPYRHRDSADMPGSSLQIDDGPVLFTLLNVAEVQFDGFMPSNAAS